MNAVDVEHVTKTFGKHVAVDDLSLAVPAGQRLRLHRAQRLGQDHDAADDHEHLLPRPRHHPGLRRASCSGACTDRIGYLPEERGLYKKMKVRDLLRVLRRPEERPGRQARGRPLARSAGPERTGPTRRSRPSARA